MKNNSEIFLSLVRLGIGHTDKSGFKFDFPLSGRRPSVQDSGSKSVDWVALKALADSQGLTAVLLDGLDALQEVQGSLPVQLKLQWIGEVLQNYEQRYGQYKNAIGSLAGFYNQHGIRMMVLKGYACSLDWPKPEHRPCGDIDIWLFGQQKMADQKLVSSFRIQDQVSRSSFKIDGSHHHHTVFEWQGFTVENHYDFVNVHAHKTGKEQEAIFKDLGDVRHTDSTESTENSSNTTQRSMAKEKVKGTNITNVLVNGESVYMPSANLHALFLIRHLANHFASMGITLRQVLDWAFFVEMHGEDVDWPWLEGLLEKYHLKDFYSCINAICVGDLGFDVKYFPSVQFEPMLKDRVLDEILSPEFDEELPKDVIRRVIYKLRRWKGNAWKHELCYNDSLWSAFWNGVWNHLLKPSSI